MVSAGWTYIDVAGPVGACERRGLSLDGKKFDSPTSHLAFPTKNGQQRLPLRAGNFANRPRWPPRTAQWATCSRQRTNDLLRLGLRRTAQVTTMAGSLWARAVAKLDYWERARYVRSFAWPSYCAWSGMCISAALGFSKPRHSTSGTIRGETHAWSHLFVVVETTPSPFRQLSKRDSTMDGAGLDHGPLHW